MGQGNRGPTYGPGWRRCSRQSKCKPCDRQYKMLSKYGLTSSRYDEMLEYQNGTCLFCPATEYVPGKRLGVDHDRSCCPGIKSCGSCIRALLCRRCNTVLGLCNDDPKLLHELAYFLERM